MDFSKLAIDVSLYDSYNIRGQLVTLDWEATGFPMAIIKSSQAKFTDPAFLLQWEAAKCLPRIAYHFFDATVNAIQQAEYAWGVVRHDFKDTDILAIDFEHYLGKNPISAHSLLALGSMMYELDKVLPPEQLMIYTGTSYWYPCGGKTAMWAKKYKHWQAVWPWDNWLLNVIPLPPKVWSEKLLSEKVGLIDAGLAKPVECLPWGRPDIWQFTARMNPAMIPSYTANKKAVDLNYIYMDLNDAPSYMTCPTCQGSGKIVIE